jgi:O-antigen/teichoic acid export membrane protein
VFSFGSFATGSDAAVFITKNVDYLLIGKLLGAEPLGVYTLAYLLTDTFRTAVMGVMNKVMYPIYGKLQADIPTLAAYYLRVIRYNTLVIVPVMVVLLVLAPQVLTNFFGPQWLPAAGATRLLAVSVILHTIGGTSAAVLKSIGRPDVEFRINLVTAVFVSIPSLWLGIHWWGITGAGAAAVVHTVVTRFLFQTYMRRLVHISEQMILRSVAPALIAGLIAGLIGISLDRLTPDSGLFITIVHMLTTLCVYAVVCGLILREDLKLAVSHVRARTKVRAV